MIPVRPEILSSTLKVAPKSAEISAACNVIPLGLHIQPLLGDTSEQTVTKQRRLRFLQTHASQSGRESAIRPGPENGYLKLPSHEEEEGIGVVDFGQSGIPRCLSCRGYINPYVEWLASNTKWRCNLCLSVNKCQNYTPLGPNLTRRRELEHASIEYEATGKMYMRRPPMPPIFLFCVDVSEASLQAGVLDTVCSTLLNGVLRSLAENPRVRVGFLTFNSTVHCYSLQQLEGREEEEAREPKMFILPDLEDVFLPAAAEDLTVALAQNFDAVQRFLEVLPSIHGSSRSSSSSGGNGRSNGGEGLDLETATGAALLAAQQILTTSSGQILLFQTGLPSLGAGRLENRLPKTGSRNPGIQTFLRFQSRFYRSFGASNANSSQIAVSLFSFRPKPETGPEGKSGDGWERIREGYTDFATLREVSSRSGGQSFWYPEFRSKAPSERVPDFRDYWQLRSDLSRVLLRTTGWEAVFRVRCSPGLEVQQYFGSFHRRNPEILSFPVVHQDSVITCLLRKSKHNPKAAPGASLDKDGSFPGQRGFVQAALLYTTSEGRRRVRVHTLCIPWTQSPQEVYRNCDPKVSASVFTKLGIRAFLAGDGLGGVQEQSLDLCQKFLQGYFREQQDEQELLAERRFHQQLPQIHRGHQRVTTGRTELPEHLQLLSRFALGILKQPLFRPRWERMDEISYQLSLLLNFGVQELERCLRPKLFPLHQLPLSGSAAEEEEEEAYAQKPMTSSLPPPLLPQELPLMRIHLQPEHVLLLDSGFELLLWVGRAAPATWVESVFGVPDLRGTDPEQLSVLQQTQLGRQVARLLEQLRAGHPWYKVCTVLPQDSRDAHRFQEYLMEDRRDFAPSLVDFFQRLYI